MQSPSAAGRLVVASDLGVKALVLWAGQALGAAGPQASARLIQRLERKQKPPRNVACSFTLHNCLKAGKELLVESGVLSTGFVFMPWL